MKPAPKVLKTPQNGMRPPAPVAIRPGNSILEPKNQSKDTILNEHGRLPEIEE
jgi:hypothetical protein